MTLFVPKLLFGKTALVTGASSGLGAHFAATLSMVGARVVLAARRTDNLRTIAADVSSRGGECEVMQLDVSDAGSVDAMMQWAPPVDILVNNAGVVCEGSCLDQSEADWDKVIDTDLKGMFLVAQAIARQMRSREAGGTIVNIASILGIRQASNVLPYTVAKAGVIQMTKSMALELARYDIRVNALAPGYLSTELNEAFLQTAAGEALVKRIPQRRLGRIDELDGPLLLLASDASSFMTGAVIAVDGGHLVSSL